MFHLQQPSHKIFDFMAYIDWFQSIKCPEMAVFDRQNQYQRADALQMRQPFPYAVNSSKIASTCKMSKDRISLNAYRSQIKRTNLAPR